MKHYGFLDLEMTCDDKQELPSHKREIISAGLVIADDNYKIKEKYHALIKPALYSDISDYCTVLTGIHQNDLNHAEDCETVFEIIWKLCLKYSVSKIFVFGSGDARAIANQAGINRKINRKTKYMMNVRRRLIDLRPAILARLHLKSKGNGLKKIAEYLDVDCKNHHNALHDAETLMKICRKTP